MKTTPLLFNAEMVRALIDGRKTQTRRVAKVNAGHCKPGFITPNAGFVPRRISEHVSYCPYGVTGNLIWVREAYRPRYFDDGSHAYAADWDGKAADCVPKPKWTPSIHMRRAASRLTLEITDVRVERLWEMSNVDARAEGVTMTRPTHVDCEGHEHSDHIGAFACLWDSINAKNFYGWQSDPWVWALTFKVHRCNVDKFACPSA